MDIDSDDEYIFHLDLIKNYRKEKIDIKLIKNYKTVIKHSTKKIK